MTQKEYIVEDRSFRTESDYKRALRDKETMDELRQMSEGYSKEQLMKLLAEVHEGKKYRFFTMLGQDFEDELTERVRHYGSAKGAVGRKAVAGGKAAAASGRTSDKALGRKRRAQDAKEGTSGDANGQGKGAGGAGLAAKVTDADVQAELKRQEKRRKWFIAACALIAVLCLGYFVVYIYYNQRTSKNYDELIALKERKPAQDSAGAVSNEEFVIHYTDEENQIAPIVLDEYKNLLNKNKRLIGWLKIDDTNIDYPVMQTTDNEYYLEHNLNQEYDKNGSIFMDKDCNVLKPSTNFILYGHHMKSGKMFGNLDKYSDPAYYLKHRYIDFDTIYEKGIYEVMYVFRSRVYSEEEVVFKYYQFIDAVSEREFDSNMREMAAVSLYDTGVTADYGDRLLTLSTCDYQEKNGRFVVVAKKVSEKE